MNEEMIDTFVDFSGVVMPIRMTRTAKSPLWPMVLGCVRLDGKPFMA